MTHVYAPIWLLALISVAFFVFGAFLGSISHGSR